MPGQTYLKESQRLQIQQLKQQHEQQKQQKQNEHLFQSNEDKDQVESLGKRVLVETKNFIFPNVLAYYTTVLTNSLTDHELSDTESSEPQYSMYYFSSLMRNTLLTSALFLWVNLVLYFRGLEKGFIHGEKRTFPSASQNLDMVLRMITVTTVCDAAEEMFMSRYIGYISNIPVYGNNDTASAMLSQAKTLIAFVLSAFIFEVFFDFVFYWVHRLVHHYPGLYKIFHKHHHSIRYPSVMVAHLQGIEIIFNNFLACIVAGYLVQILGKIPFLGLGLTKFGFHLILSYKVLMELAGHSGVALPGIYVYIYCLTTVFLPMHECSN